MLLTPSDIQAANEGSIVQPVAPPGDATGILDLPDVRQLLQQGVNAAKAGDKAQARLLLQQVTGKDADNVVGWLWLASVSDDAQQRFDCIQRVLSLDPTNERARSWITVAKNQLTQELFQKGINAAKSGDRASANFFLLQATELDFENEQGWLWLASVTDAPEEKLSYLQRVLNINPANERAQAAFSGTKTQLARALLQESVTAAKAGDRLTAREILRDVMEYDPNLEEGWLVMAYVADAMEEKADCFRRVLEMNPANERAIAGLKSVEAMSATPLPAWRCPLCRSESEKEVSLCTTCGAVLTLDDLDRLLDNGHADIERISTELTRLEATLTEDSSAEDHITIGLGYLNLKQLDEGLAHLETALRLDSGREDLRLRVASLVERRAALETATRTREEAEKLLRRTIMVVDDSPTVRKLVTLKLEGQGHHVIAATDGIDALAKLNESIPDLILSDITMPRMDGYQLCKLIKSNPTTKHIPVVMLSGKDGFFDKMRGRVAGSTAHMTKPFEPDELIKTVAKYCGLSEV